MVYTCSKFIEKRHQQMSGTSMFHNTCSYVLINIKFIMMLITYPFPTSNYSQFYLHEERNGLFLEYFLYIMHLDKKNTFFLNVYAL